MSQGKNTPDPKRKAYLTPLEGTLDPIALNVPLVFPGTGADHARRDSAASRPGARLLIVHNRYYVQDLGDSRGTFLNGKRVENARLTHGDLLLIGDSPFRVDIGADLDTDYLKTLNLDALISLAEAVDRKDPYTGNHSRAVAQVAELLAHELGLDATSVERVHIAARLHDIGKIDIADAVLRKQGRLNEAEYALIRRHPLDAETILAPLACLADLLPVVRQHHEHIDGTGYPDGLMGTEIALEARLIAVADAYHSMASRRPYRDVRSLEFVRRELMDNAGTQFDREIVEVFLRLLPTIYANE